MRKILLTGTALLAMTAALPAVAQTDSDGSRGRPYPESQNQPGRSETAPGQTRPPATSPAPGRSESAPGQNRPPATTAQPGRSESAPGQRRGETSPDETTRPGATGAEGTEPGRQPPRQGQREAEPGDQRVRPGAEGTDQERRGRQGQAGEDERRRPGATGAGPERTGQERTGQGQERTGQDRSRPGDQPGEERQGTGDADRGGGQRLGARLEGQERTRVTTTLVERARPIDRSRIDFRINVGATVPQSDITLVEVPDTIVRLVPEYRGYRYFVVENEIVIVEPGSRRIVEVIERGGGRSGATGAAGGITIDRSKLSIVRRELRSRGPVNARIEVRQGAILPQDVELWQVPQVVLQEVPEIRGYRYIVYQDRILLVEPDSRRIVDVIE